MKMNKKGLELFAPMIAIFTLILLSAAMYFLILQPRVGEQERIIGERAFAIFDLDQDSKISEFMREEGLVYASYNALVRFGEKSGGCEDWSLCKPDLNKFRDYAKEEYIKVLKNLGVRKEERENYTIDLKIEDKSFVVSANTKEKIFFAKEGVYYKIEHKPFSKKINYNLNIYNELYNKYHDSKKPCSEYELKDNIKCDDLSDEIYIKFEATTEDLLFIKPVIKFKVVKLGQVKRSK